MKNKFDILIVNLIIVLLILKLTVLPELTWIDVLVPAWLPFLIAAFIWACATICDLFNE